MLQQSCSWEFLCVSNCTADDESTVCTFAFYNHALQILNKNLINEYIGIIDACIMMEHFKTSVCQCVVN